MRTEIRDEKVGKGKYFPRLMKGIYSGNVVLFANEKIGVCVCSKNPDLVGVPNKEFDMAEFEEFTGVVELSND